MPSIYCWSPTAYISVNSLTLIIHSFTVQADYFFRCPSLISSDNDLQVWAALWFLMLSKPQLPHLLCTLLESILPSNQSHQWIYRIHFIQQSTISWSRKVLRYTENSLNSIPNNKILDLTKLKAFADDKFNVTKLTIFLFDRVENIVGKGKNAGYKHFLLFPQCFQKPSSPGSLKVGIVW